jgi:hypothetical protein
MMVEAKVTHPESALYLIFLVRNLLGLPQMNHIEYKALKEAHEAYCRRKGIWRQRVWINL